MKNKNVVLYGVIALVAVVAIAFFTGRIPPKGNVEGTIGGANRYQSQQISDQDVVLKDPQVQAFLQSDLFHKLQTNPELAQIVRNENFQISMKNASFANLINVREQLAVSNQAMDFDKIIASSDFRTLLADPRFTDLLTAANVGQVKSAREWNTLVAGSKYAAVRELAAYKPVAEQLSVLGARQEFRNLWAMDANAVKLVRSDAFAAVANTGELATFLVKGHPADLAQAMATKEFQQIVAAGGDMGRLFEVKPR